jgi:hypothetical protein
MVVGPPTTTADVALKVLREIADSDFKRFLREVAGLSAARQA